jgi:hypothetical protein
MPAVARNFHRASGIVAVGAAIGFVLAHLAGAGRMSAFLGFGGHEYPLLP